MPPLQRSHRYPVTSLPGHIVTRSHRYIVPLQRSHCYPGCFKTLRCRTELFRNSFLPLTVNEWNKLDSDIKNSVSFAIFRKHLLAFIRAVGNSIYGTYDPVGVRLINRLRLGFSYLRQHKSRHNFADTVWTRYAHALLKLKIQIISFYAAKTYLLAQPLWMN